VYISTQWAHGDGVNECEDGEGTCQRQVASKGAENALICVGGVMNNENCNQAVGCDCNDGFYGAHCEQDIVVCDVFRMDFRNSIVFHRAQLGARQRKVVSATMATLANTARGMLDSMTLNQTGKILK
jgi:hypothetical protein